jgi:hypothetical protein
MPTTLEGEITDPFPLSSLRAIPPDRLRDLAEAAGVDLDAVIEEDEEVGRTIRASAIKAFIPHAEGYARGILSRLWRMAEEVARERAAGSWKPL